MLINANQMTIEELIDAIRNAKSEVVVVLYRGESMCFATNELARKLIVGEIAKRLG